MKKWVIGLIALASIGIVFATVAGYTLLTAVSHFDVTEGIELQYYETASGTWIDLPTGQTVNLGLATIKPGETNTFFIRGRNTAATGVLDVALVSDPVEGLSHTLVCNNVSSTGVNWDVNAGVYHVKVVAGAGWQEVGMTTTADGAIALQSVSFNNVVSRNNGLDTYDFVCP